jgi:uncharacterized protein YbbC (DUF1343 family)
MAMALEAAKAAGIPFIVLDRPNPVGGVEVQGPVLDEPGLAYVSAVAYLAVPTRHGMTPGELALLHNEHVQHNALAVIKLRGWKREMWFDDTGLPWVPPSPNMPSLDAAALYPGIANIEEANVSVGRGTPYPFNWVGAPWLDAPAVMARLEAAKLAGVGFSLKDYTPTKSFYAGRLCRGVRMKVTDRRAVRPLRVFAHLIAAIRDLHSKEFKPQWDDTRKLVGLAAFRELYERGAPAEELAAAMDPDPAAFLSRRKPFLLYE